VRPSVIAIDYDGTYTVDPDLWRAFIERAQARGHTVVMVTGRSNEGQFGAEVRRDVRGLVPIVFAAQMWKWHAAQLAGFDVAIWIEDHPETVCKPPPILSKERTAHGACGTCHADLAARSITTETDRVFVFYCPRCENDDLTRLARTVGK
jgi:hypothetical protein